MSAMVAHGTGSPDDVVRQLAAAVGIEPEQCTGLTIEVFPNDLIRVRSNHTATGGTIEQVANIFERAKASGLFPAVAERSLIPNGRLADLRLRADVGALTPAERLALAVLSGGRDSEDGIGALIDAAQEEYGHGSYRVPVRIIADRDRTRFVLTASANEPVIADRMRVMRANLESGLEKWIAGETKFLVLPAGWSIQAIELPEESEGTA